MLLIYHFISHLGTETELQLKSESLPPIFKRILFCFFTYIKVSIFREIVGMGKKSSYIWRNLNFKSGKDFISFTLGGFPQLLLWIEGKKVCICFSPMCNFEQCSYVIWNDYAKCLWELESWCGYIVSLWDPKENNSKKIGKAREFWKWRASMRWASRELNEKFGWFEQIVYIFSSLRPLRSLLIHCMGKNNLCFLFSFLTMHFHHCCMFFQAWLRKERVI